MKHILSQADIIFTYSTALTAKGFDENIGAMVLSDEWSKLLAENCNDGCVVITTDRILDAGYGWDMRRSLSVDNPKLFGSIGYVSILRK